MNLPVLIDGVTTPSAEASVSVFDQAVQRGLGCFEAMRSYGGCVFRLDAHLDRLDRSASALGLELPARDDLSRWIVAQADAGTALPGDGSAVRVFVTGGIEGIAGSSRVIVTVASPPPRPASLRLASVEAPWHPAGRWSELTGAKTISYAPNMAAREKARSRGSDDALLTSVDGVVLEGPTFTVAWVNDSRVYTPSLDLGILSSITRTALLEVAAEVGVPVVEGHFGLEVVKDADEVVALSTFKEIVPVMAIDDRPLDVGPLTVTLQAGLRALIEKECR
ncbi:MAG: hypothetical protein HKN07_15635 [Acidimicrobiia bacterium]|nr:hypothetical protein [Acidimicrobiia bacterium]